MIEEDSEREKNQLPESPEIQPQPDELILKREKIFKNMIEKQKEDLYWFQKQKSQAEEKLQTAENEIELKEVTILELQEKLKQFKDANSALKRKVLEYQKNEAARNSQPIRLEIIKSNKIKDGNIFFKVSSALCI